MCPELLLCGGSFWGVLGGGSDQSQLTYVSGKHHNLSILNKKFKGKM